MDIEFNIEQHQMLNLKSQMYTLGIFFRQFVVVVVVMFIRLPLWEKNRRFIRTENMCVSIMCILAGAFLPWVLVIFISENACMFPLQTMSSLHKQKKKRRISYSVLELIEFNLRLLCSYDAPSQFKLIASKCLCLYEPNVFCFWAKSNKRKI